MEIELTAMAQQLAEIMQRYEQHQRERAHEFTPRLHTPADFAQAPLPPVWVCDSKRRSAIRCAARLARFGA
jgi:hypothetical protein